MYQLPGPRYNQLPHPALSPVASLVLELVDLVGQAAQRQEGVAAAKGGGGARQVGHHVKHLVQHLPSTVPIAKS